MASRRHLSFQAVMAERQGCYTRRVPSLHPPHRCVSPGVRRGTSRAARRRSGSFNTHETSRRS